MRDLFDVLREKETDLVRVRLEVEALRCAATLLFEGDDRLEGLPDIAWAETAGKNRWPLDVEGPRESAG